MRRKLTFVDDDKYNLKGLNVLLCLRPVLWPSQCFLNGGVQVVLTWLYPENCVILSCLRGWYLTPAIVSTASCITRMWWWAKLKWGMLQSGLLCMFLLVFTRKQSQKTVWTKSAPVLRSVCWSNIKCCSQDILTNNIFYYKQPPYITDTYA